MKFYCCMIDKKETILKIFHHFKTLNISMLPSFRVLSEMLSCMFLGNTRFNFIPENVNNREKSQ